MASTVKIIEAGPEWADAYRLFCQKAYEASYPRPELGVTADLFSLEVFSSPSLCGYFDRLFASDSGNKVWLALDENGEITGGVVAKITSGVCEMSGFYVRSDLRGRGIGKALFRHVEQYAGNRPIHLDVVQYMQSTIDMYRRWGFVVDTSRGLRRYPWRGWSEQALEAFSGIYMSRPAVEK